MSPGRDKRTAGRWQLSTRIATWSFVIGTGSVALLAVVSVALVHLETRRELDALVTEELEEIVPPFAASGGTPADFELCGEELQRSHPTNDMAWRVWRRSNGALWGTFGRVEPRAFLPATAAEAARIDRFHRWRVQPLNAELDVGLLISGGLEARSERTFVTVALSTVALAATVSFLAGKVLGRRVGGVLREIAAEARDATGTAAAGGSDEHLPDEVREVVAALRAALARIREESDQARLLASGLAHELRSPLQNLLMQAEVALLREREPKEYRGALARQIQDLQELIRGVDNLVTLCASPEARRARSGETFDFAAEARLRLRGEQARAERGKMELDLQLPASLPFRGDREGLMLALRNLVSNAIDWSPPGGRIEVRVAVHEELPNDGAERALRIEVDDQGPGVPEAERARIFRPFERGPARPDGRVGYGLGLALVRTVADLHHGRVQVGSSPLGGASFHLDLPAPN